jgi:small-conductance mechanosensitive channel
LTELLQGLERWSWSVGIFLVAAILGLVSHYLLFKTVNRLANRKTSALYSSLIRHIRKPSSIIEERDNLRARKIHTQFLIIKKVLIAVIAIITFAGILMSFDRFRYLGTSILASAGLASLIVGFAAESALSNLLAGIQIALTRPFNIDDIVIVEIS